MLEDLCSACTWSIFPHARPLLINALSFIPRTQDLLFAIQGAEKRLALPVKSTDIPEQDESKVFFFPPLIFLISCLIDKQEF